MSHPLVVSRDDLELIVDKTAKKTAEETLKRLRQAIQPAYLTKAQLMELTGWSSRQVEYRKSKRQIPFIRRGRTVLFPYDEIVAWIEEGRVHPKK